jgi:hypothetical protein
MAKIDELIAAYGRHIGLPWQSSAPGASRVVMVVYPEGIEREIRARLPEFALQTTKADHTWHHIDLTGAFAAWINAHTFREQYFASPRLLDRAALTPFTAHVAGRVHAALDACHGDPTAVVAITGTGSLYGVAHVSEILRMVDHAIPGRVVVFFPGELEQNNYRLLGARDGWNYLAVAITA